MIFDLYLIWKYKLKARAELARLRFKKIEARVDLTIATLNRSNKYLQFISGEFSKEGGADSDLDSKIEGYRLENKYKYFRELDRCCLSTNSKAYSWQKRANVIFTDKLEDAVDPKDLAIKLIIDEATQVVPQLLVHPNDEVRRLVKKYIDNNTKGITK
jgi:hypothetical protein